MSAERTIKIRVTRLAPPMPGAVATINTGTSSGVLKIIDAWVAPRASR